MSFSFLKRLGFFKTFLIISIIVLIYNYYQISNYKEVSLNLKSKKIRAPLRISQISDFHSNRYIDLDRLVGDIAGYGPDMIVLTGDIIDRKDRDLTRAVELIDRLVGLDRPLYFVVGNHEYANINSKNFIGYMEKKGIVVLDNELLEFKEEAINLVGFSFAIGEEDYKSLLSRVNPDYYTIVLSHSPKYPIEYRDSREDLIISGHTHGGQVRLPLIGALVSPSEGFFPSYSKGLYEIENTLLYINAGLGNSLLNFRLFNRVEYSNISLEIE